LLVAKGEKTAYLETEICLKGKEPKAICLELNLPARIFVFHAMHSFMTQLVHRRLWLFLGCLFLGIGWIPAQGTHERCGAEIFRQTWQESHPEFRTIQEELEELIASTPPTELQTRSIITIPVVVHVVYRLASQNISDEQIYSQITVLNEDFRAQNDLTIIPPQFLGLISDTEIEFCLANQDPIGNPTLGITRTMTDKDNIGLDTDVHYDMLGGKNGWDPDRYLNIWVADMGDNISGRASFPDQSPPAEDGVVIDPRYFGTIGTASNSQPYHLGRTTTHEVGHYFNLLHVWGSGSPSCSNDDFVPDTPLSSQNFLGDCPFGISITCGTVDMHTNYMYYTNDACMGQFTPGQKHRMLVTLATSRSELAQSDACEPAAVVPQRPSTFSMQLFPNPTSSILQIEVTDAHNRPTQLQIIDATGRLVHQQAVNFPESISISVDQFAAGVYWARLTGTNQQVTQRFVVIH
jgi:hypothetical protein